MPYNLNIPGWMPESELKIIEQVARTIPRYGKMVEVGPFCGRSSWCWAQSVDPTVRIVCIDIWNPAEHPYHPPTVIGSRDTTNADFGVADSLDQVVGTLENFRHFTRDCSNIVPIRGASPYDFQNWNEPLDLVFLDGVHHNPVFWDDLNFWFWKLKPGGLCCGDDYARTHPDVVWGVHDFAKNHDLTFFVQGRLFFIPRPPHKSFFSTLFGQTGYCWRIRLGLPGPRFRLPRSPHPTQAPACRPPTGIRQQYQTAPQKASRDVTSAFVVVAQQ